MSRLPQAERRRQLVEAAIAVMTRDGVRKATTRAIVNEAGTSLSVFHYCFTSKQDLLDAVIRQLVGTTVDLAEASFPPDAPRRELIRSGLAAYWDHVTTHPQEHLLTYELTQYCLRTPGHAEVAHHQYEHYGQTFVEILQALGLEGRVPLEDVGRYLAVMVDGLTLDWIARRDDAQAQRMLDLLVDQVEGMLL
jgi:AcrR family transcriptional regulator